MDERMTPGPTGGVSFWGKSIGEGHPKLSCLLSAASKITWHIPAFFATQICHVINERVLSLHRLGLTVGILLLAWGGLSLRSASADGPILVGLYVQFEDGSVFTQCVELEGPEATGLEVLRRAELELIYETGGFLGTAICKIGATGCDYPAQDCFCQCPGQPCEYWTYWYAEEGQWKVSPQGASSRRVEDGDIEGWVWGDGQTWPPAEILAQDICPATLPASPVAGEMQERSPTPPLARASATPMPTQTIAKVKSITRSPSPPSQSSLSTEITTPTPLPPPSVEDSSEAGSPTFLWLMAGLSGLGIVLLGIAYFLTSRRL